LRERSRVLAFVGAWLLFVLAHVPQTFGQWGAVVAIGVMGLGLTTMRAITGSTLVPALAHLTYNGLIAIQAVAA
jgi:membrane protease YdiL (CAAX protease family)